MRGRMTGSNYLTVPDAPWSVVNAATLTNAIDANSALIVRELIPSNDVHALSAGFQKALQAAEADDVGDWYAPVDEGGGPFGAVRTWVRSVDCALLADSPAMLALVLDVYRRNGVIDLVAEHLRETPMLSAQKSTLRRTFGNKSYGDNWHQDGAFLGSETKVVNVWLALTNCGERAASVEIGLPRHVGIVRTGGEGALYDWSVSPQTAATVLEAAVTPVCAPGDAVMFDHLCMHRTSLGAHYTEDRLAIEAWFFGPSTYPRHLRPIAV